MYLQSLLNFSVFLEKSNFQTFFSRIIILSDNILYGWWDIHPAQN